ncbi:11843_t:CDS:1, partial [Scutellospora calospora]
EKNIDISNSSNNRLDDILNQILDATDSISQIKKRQDNNIIQQELLETKRFKMYYLLVEEYKEWIKNLERARLSYNKHNY